jgi:low affinity Fe/Cu permease
MSWHDRFSRFAHQSAQATGSPWAFVVALAVVLLWAITGPLFGFSDTWQLVINTGTTVVTFLIVFLIQCTQNRDTLALQLKLDELVRSEGKARTGLVDLEELSDEELERLHQEFKDLRLRTARETHRRASRQTARGGH